MNVIEKMNRAAFLGPEFLTWLWYRTETAGEVFSCEAMEGPFEVWFDDRLVVGSTMVNAQENHFKGGHPPTSLEARTALRLGKLATEARLRVVNGAREWSFVLKGASMELGGVKLPAVLAKEDDDRVYERLYLLEQLEGTIKGLFGQFLKLRLSDAWSQSELPSIHAWVGGAVTTPSRAVDASAVRHSVPIEESMTTEIEENPGNDDVPPWEDPLGGPVE